MHYPSGSFTGYRELEIPAVGGPSSTMPPLIIPFGAGIEPWELPALPRVPYDYRSFRGTASDNFPVAFIPIDEDAYEGAGFVCSVMEANVHKSEVQVAISIDGVTVSSLFILRGHKLRILKARGFMIRSLVPGDDCHYQLVFYR